MFVYSLVNAALCGFFGFAAVHYFLQWWLSRSEGRLLVFAVYCALCACYCPVLILLVHATTVAEAQFALNLRTSLGILITGAAFVFMARLDARASPIVMWAGLGVFLLAFVATFGVPVNGPVIALESAPLLGADPITVPVRGPGVWWLWLIYTIAISPYVYGLYIARGIWPRDRWAAFLVGFGSLVSVVAIGLVATLIDFFHLRTIYVGILPQALFVLVMGVFLSREYAARHVREQAAKREFSSVFEYAAIGMGLVSPEGRWLKVNASLCEMLGYTPEELTARTFQEITHPDDLQEDLNFVRRLLAGEIETYQMEKRYIHKDGHVIWILLSVSLFRDKRGVPAYFISQVQNITKRKQAELSLIRQKNLYAMLSETNAAILHVRSREHLFAELCRIAVVHGRLSFALVLLNTSEGDQRVVAQYGDDRGFLEMLNSSPDFDKIIEQGPAARAIRAGERVICNDYLNDEAARPLWSAAERAGIRAASMCPLWEYGKVIGVLNLYAREPGYFTVDLLPTLDEIAEVVSLALEHQAGQDELRVVSQRLLEAEETERRNVARELHDEVGQTLTAARIQLQQLEQQSKGTAIGAQLSEASAAVSGLLAQVRQLSLDLHPVVLDDLGLAAALEWYGQNRARQSGLRIVVDVPRDLPRYARVLETTVFRVFQESLSNVMRHAAAKQVLVALEVTGDNLRLTVHDDGKGFDLGAARRRALSGASLGLVGMEERVRLAGGDIVIESAPGRGTVVQVVLQAKPPPKPP